MLSINSVLPLFALILTGWGMAKARIIDPAGVKGLTTFVFSIAVPALFFRTIGRGLPEAGIDVSILYAYYSGALLTYGLGILTGLWLLRLRFDGATLVGMGGSYSNTVQIGIPLLFAVFGEAGVLPTTLIIMVHSILLIPLTIILVEIGRGEDLGLAKLARTVLGQMLRNPLILGILAGLAWAFLHLGPLPKAIDQVFALLTQSVTPCALIALGASLPNYRLTGEPKVTLAMVLLKLVAMPAIVHVMASRVFDMPPLWALVATMTAALPIGVNVFVVVKGFENRSPGTAQAEGRSSLGAGDMAGPVSGGVLLSTAGSLVTLTILVALLPPG